LEGLSYFVRQFIIGHRLDLKSQKDFLKKNRLELSRGGENPPIFLPKTLGNPGARH
jgi:hypothetical protein